MLRRLHPCGNHRRRSVKKKRKEIDFTSTSLLLETLQGEGGNLISSLDNYYRADTWRYRRGIEGTKVFNGIVRAEISIIPLAFAR